MGIKMTYMGLKVVLGRVLNLRVSGRVGLWNAGIGPLRVIPVTHVAGFGSGSRVCGSGILRQFLKKIPVQKF